MVSVLLHVCNSCCSMIVLEQTFYKNIKCTKNAPRWCYRFFLFIFHEKSWGIIFIISFLKIWGWNCWCDQYFDVPNPLKISEVELQHCFQLLNWSIIKLLVDMIKSHKVIQSTYRVIWGWAEKPSPLPKLLIPIWPPFSSFVLGEFFLSLIITIMTRMII